MYLMQDDEDARLVARCRAGDMSAFETLVRRYERVLFTVALRMLGNRDEAADATQETFVRVYERLETYDATRRFFPWMYRILMNDCLNTLRSRRPQAPITDETLIGPGPFEALDAAERAARVQAALLSLPAEQREVIVLRHFAELSYEDIGGALDIPVKTVKSRIHGGKSRLARLLGGQGD